MEEKIKVLHILHELHPSGAEMMLYNAYPYWKDECACTVMATGQIAGPFADALKEIGYEIAFVPTRGGGKRAKLKHLLEFWRYMKRHSYDVVHIHRESLSFEYALIARLTGCRRILRTVHSTFSHTGIQRKLKGTTRRLMRRMGVTFVAISDGVAENERNVFHNDCGEVIYNWCDNQKFRFVSNEEKKQEKEKKGLSGLLMLVTVGNCGDVKNHGLLLEAIARMKQRERVHYLHVGYAKGETETEQTLAARLGILEQVEFLGSTDPAPYLRRADVFVMTSRYEGLSIATLEAIFTGMRVLLAEAPGLTEFRGKGLSGVDYFKPDAQSLADCLDAYVKKYDAGELSPDAGQRRRAEELYDCGRQSEKYQRLYREKNRGKT